jgi:hypothetical protein
MLSLIICIILASLALTMLFRLLIHPMFWALVAVAIIGFGIWSWNRQRQDDAFHARLVAEEQARKNDITVALYKRSHAVRESIGNGPFDTNTAEGSRARL